MSFVDDDLAQIFSASNPLAVLAAFDPSGTNVEVYGLFTDGTDATVMYGVDVEAQNPSITCRQSDVSTVENRMKVTINSTQYTVERIAKSGSPGVTTVYLKT